MWGWHTFRTSWGWCPTFSCVWGALKRVVHTYSWGAGIQILKWWVHFEGYLAWLLISCLVFLILIGWHGYSQSHAFRFLCGSIYVFIIWYLRGLDWCGMDCPFSVNGFVFGSHSWFIILNITDHSWFLDEGVFFVPGMDFFCCAELMVLVVSWWQIEGGYIVTWS